MTDLGGGKEAAQVVIFAIGGESVDWHDSGIILSVN